MKQLKLGNLLRSHGKERSYESCLRLVSPKLANLKKRPVFVGDVQDIIGKNWSGEWSEAK